MSEFAWRRDYREWLNWAITVNTIVIFLTGVIPWYFGESPSSEIIPIVVMGLIAGEVSSASAYSALITRRRLPGNLMGIVWVVGAGIPLSLLADGPFFLALFALGMLLVLIWALAWGIMWGVLALLRLRPVSLDELAELGPPQSFQFSIWNLMILTAGVAGVFGLGRLLAGTSAATQLFAGLLLMLIFPVGNFLLATLLILAWLFPQRQVLAAILALTAVGICTALQVGGMRGLFGEPLKEIALFFGCTNVTQGLIVSLNLWLMRNAGYRLMRVAHVAEVATIP